MQILIEKHSHQLILEQFLESCCSTTREGMELNIEHLLWLN